MAEFKADQISTNGDFNYFRKIWHLLGLILPVFVYADPLRNQGGLADLTRLFATVFLIISLLLIVLVDYFRLKSEKFQGFFYKYFGFLMKEEEKLRMNATIPYFFANLVLFLFFSREVAVISCIFLMFGDPFAAFVGLKYGKIRIKNGKSLEGLIAFFIFALLFSIMFILIHSIHSSAYDSFSLFRETLINYDVLIILTFGSIIAAFTEFYSKNMLYGLVDDNLLIPLTSAVSISLIAYTIFDFPVYTLFYNPFDLFIRI